MKSKKTTRRALLTSMLSLLLCVSMLVGSTFAWFTDSVTSQNNIIKSGNLDVELYYQVEGKTDWTKVTDTTNIFKENALWEPGHTEVVKLKVVNEGTLALKYQLGVNVASETESTNVKNEPLKLSDHIKFGIVDGAQTYTREEAVAAVERTANALNVVYNSGTVKLEAKNDTDSDEKIVTLVVYMPTTVGNEANYAKGAAVPTINLGINLFATQVEAEMDSFGSDYDKDAWHPEMSVGSAADLQAAIDAGETNIVLTNDIELTEAIVIPAPATSTYSLRAASNAIVINLNGKTINNSNGYVIENQGNLVITGNGTISGLGCIRSKAGSITIESGNFFASSRWQDSVYQHTLKAENTVVEINGGNFDATEKGHTNAVFNASENGVITINGGTFKNVDGALANFDPYLFTYEKNGKVIINDGTFFGGWRFNGETATTDIYGGNFTVGFDGQSFHADSTHVLTVYGGTFVPNAAYPNSSLAGKISGVVAKYYVATENDDGSVTVAPRPGTGKVAYRAYVLNGSREAIQIDMEQIFAMKSLKIELWHDDTLLTTTTYAGSYPADRPGYTTACVALKGGFASWNTVIAEGVTLTNLNVPDTIKVYADGTLTHTFTHNSGTVLGDKVNDYLALSSVGHVEVVNVTAPSTDKVQNGEALAETINTAADTVLLNLGTGEYKMPSINGSKNVTIVGTKDTVIDITLGAYMDSSTIAFEGVTIKGSTGKANGNGSDYAALYTPNVTYTNCTFEGPFRVGRDGATFINCTFNSLGNDYVWTYGNDVTFEGCTFNSEGKAILIYSDGGSEVAKVTVKNCIFNATMGRTAYAIANQNCAAIEIDNFGNGVNLTTSGNTYDSNFSGEWRIKSYNASNPKVIVNDVEYTSIALDGKTMTIDADRNVTVNP